MELEALEVEALDEEEMEKELIQQMQMVMQWVSQARRVPLPCMPMLLFFPETLGYEFASPRSPWCNFELLD